MAPTQSGNNNSRIDISKDIVVIAKNLSPFLIFNISINDDSKLFNPSYFSNTPLGFPEILKYI